jgi:hypothetical protein
VFDEPSWRADENINARVVHRNVFQRHVH